MKKDTIPQNYDLLTDKKCATSENFAFSEEIQVDATLSDFIWNDFHRCTLRASPSSQIKITFDRWYKKYVRWRFFQHNIVHYLKFQC